MTDERMEKFLLKLIEQTKEGKLKWENNTRSDDHFRCSLSDGVNVFITDPYRSNQYKYRFFMGVLDQVENFYPAKSSQAGVLMLRLWNLLDSTFPPPPNRVEQFIDNYIGESTSPA